MQAAGIRQQLQGVAKRQCRNPRAGPAKPGLTCSPQRSKTPLALNQER